MILLATLFLAAAGFAQPPAFQSTIMDLAKGTMTTDRFINEMASLSSQERTPARLTLVNFANELVVSVKGRPMTKSQAGRLGDCIVAALRGTLPNHVSVMRLEDTLKSLGISAAQTKNVSRNFLALAEEVRGPDDIPVRGLSTK